MKQIALFDFDGTVIPGDSIVHLLRFTARHKDAGPLRALPGLLGGVLYALRLTNECASKNRALAFLSRMDANRRDRFLNSFVKQDLLPRVYRDAAERIRRLKARGCEVWLVSASTENYMETVRRELGADRLICTVQDKDGTVRSNCKGEEKARRIREALIKTEDTVICEAYADSRSDLPMLRMAKQPFAVNPKRALRKAAPDIRVLLWH